MHSPAIDDTDKKVLNALHRDPATGWESIGVCAGITRQSAAKHVERLLESGIFSYSAVENPLSLGARLFFLEIKTNPEEPDVVEFLKRIPGIRGIDGVIGTHSLTCKFIARGTEVFQDFLSRVDDIITGTRFQHYKIIECLKTYKDGGKLLWPPASSPIAIDDLDERLVDMLVDQGTNRSVQDGESNKWVSYTQLTEMLKFKLAKVTYEKVRRRVKALLRSSSLLPSIRMAPGFVQETDYKFKFYLQVLPKRLLQYEQIAAEILAVRDEIVELHRTGEQYGLLAVVRTKSIQDYRDFIEDLYRTRAIQDTVTTLVIDEKLPSIFKPFNVNLQG